VASAPSTIAFYLPQFYPIPENDGWYGPGFSEWRNVVQSKPLFEGHYQPHLPRDFGFYDLRVPEIRAQQARAAKAHGIDAFCYYHYWFEGQRPLGYGADAAAQFIPHGTAELVPRITVRGSSPGNHILAYSDVAWHYKKAQPPAWRRYECVVPDWDNSPRRGDGRSVLMHGSTPALYEDWLATVHARAGSDGIVLINAWNEWAEGAHLEPDLVHGDAYLKATARAVGAAGKKTESAVATPLSATPFELRDRFADLYLDGLETQTILQRRLSRLEATFERQVAAAVRGANEEAEEMRAHALTLTREVERLREQLASRTSRIIFSNTLDSDAR
jgi:hypothetical protein